MHACMYVCIHHDWLMNQWILQFHDINSSACKWHLGRMLAALQEGTLQGEDRIMIDATFGEDVQLSPKHDDSQLFQSGEISGNQHFPLRKQTILVCQVDRRGLFWRVPISFWKDILALPTVTVAPAIKLISKQEEWYPMRHPSGS